MVRRKEECPVSVRENMRGGNGSVQITDFVYKAELYNSGRLFADITLAPGCGIGEHVHVGEEEIFVVSFYVLLVGQRIASIGNKLTGQNQN